MFEFMPCLGDRHECCHIEVKRYRLGSGTVPLSLAAMACSKNAGLPGSRPKSSAAEPWLPAGDFGWPGAHTPKAVAPHMLAGKQQPVMMQATAKNLGRMKATQFVSGIPLPPTPGLVLGSPELMGHHAYRWLKENQKALTFRPDSHVVVVQGRPMLHLVASHNDAPAVEWDPYMRYALRPLNPLLCVGVSAETSAAPKLKRAHCVVEWLKASIFYLSQKNE